MTPHGFIEEKMKEGCNLQQAFEAWYALQDRGVAELRELAKTRERRGVSLPDSQQVAQKIFGEWGEDTVQEQTSGLLGQGMSRGVWEMQFYDEDWNRIPEDEAVEEVHKYYDLPEPRPEWEWGKKTHIWWMLKEDHDHGG